MRLGNRFSEFFYGIGGSIGLRFGIGGEREFLALARRINLSNAPGMIRVVSIMARVAHLDSVA